MERPHRLLLLCMATISITVGVSAQGAHYWTSQYGARSTLLTNSVIGSVNDLGAVFYNPGRLGLIKDPTFILSADVYEFSRVLFKDIPGNDVTLSTSDVGSVPGFVAGTFRLKKLEGHTFAYSVLMRQRNDADIRYREEFMEDLYEEVPGEEWISSSVILDERLRQQWFSLSWAYSPAQDWGVGATLSGVRYNTRKLVGFDIRVLTQANEIGFYKYDRFYNFSRYGLLAKFGISHKKEGLDWGVTLTTPIIGLFGKGEIDYSEILEPIDGSSLNYFATTQKDDLDAKLKTPLSIGAGASLSLSKIRLHMGVEWFSAISRYEMMKSTFTPQTGGDPAQLRVVEDLRSVFNVGVGAEYSFADKLSLYLGASTDFSAVRDNTDFLTNDVTVQNSTFKSNLYHVASGIVFEINKSDITLGLSYTGANQPLERIVGIPEDDGDPIIDPENPAVFKWTRIQVVLGFSLAFIQNQGSQTR